MSKSRMDNTQLYLPRRFSTITRDTTLFQEGNALPTPRSKILRCVQSGNYLITSLDTKLSRKLDKLQMGMLHENEPRRTYMAHWRNEQLIKTLRPSLKGIDDFVCLVKYGRVLLKWISSNKIRGCEMDLTGSK